MPYRRVYIKQFNAICVVVFLLFFRPASYIIGSTANAIMNYSVLGVAIVLLCIGLYLRRYGYRINRCLVLTFLLYFWCLVGSSMVSSISGNPIDYSGAVVALSNMIAFTLICDIGLWYSPKKLMKCFLIVGVTLCTINAITMIMYHNKGGMYHELTIRNRINNNYYFFGEDNASYFWSWPVIVVCWIYYYLFNMKRVFLVIAILFTVFVTSAYIYTYSLLAAIACLAVLISSFIFNRRIKSERINSRKSRMPVGFSFMWKIALAFDTLVPTGVILSYLVPIIQHFFNKSSTLSYRTLIWDKAIKFIWEKPIFGYGNEPMLVSISKIIANHTHNLVLETLYRGGIIGVLLLVLMMSSLSKKAKDIRDSAIYKYVSVMIFMFLIYSSMYFAYYRYHYLILLIIMMHKELFYTKQDKTYLSLERD